MERVYAWAKKRSRKVHIVGLRGKTFCQVENGSRRKYHRGTKPPEGREICANCLTLEEQGGPKYRPWEPSLRVLMGEAMK